MTCPLTGRKWILHLDFFLDIKLPLLEKALIPTFGGVREFCKLLLLSCDGSQVLQRTSAGFFKLR